MLTVVEHLLGICLNKSKFSENKWKYGSVYDSLDITN